MDIIYWYWIISILMIIIILSALYGLFRIKRIKKKWLKGLIIGSFPSLILAVITLIGILTNSLLGKINSEADLGVVLNAVYTLYSLSFSILGIIIGSIINSVRSKKN